MNGFEYPAVCSDGTYAVCLDNLSLLSSGSQRPSLPSPLHPSLPCQQRWSRHRRLLIVSLPSPGSALLQGRGSRSASRKNDTDFESGERCLFTPDPGEWDVIIQSGNMRRLQLFYRWGSQVLELFSPPQAKKSKSVMVSGE